MGQDHCPEYNKQFVWISVCILYTLVYCSRKNGFAKVTTNTLESNSMQNLKDICGFCSIARDVSYQRAL